MRSLCGHPVSGLLLCIEEDPLCLVEWGLLCHFRSPPPYPMKELWERIGGRTVFGVLIHPAGHTQHYISFSACPLMTMYGRFVLFPMIPQ